MTKMTDDTIGVDISKATLDIHRLSDGKIMSRIQLASATGWSVSKNS
jgi:hypothetical protein